MKQISKFLQDFSGARIVSVLAVGLSAYHLVTAYFGTPIAEIHLSVHLGLALTILFWVHRQEAQGARRIIFAMRDLALTAMALAGSGYLALNAAEIQQRMLYFDPLTTGQMAFGGMLIVAVLEAARRVVGWPLFALGAGFLVYAVFGNLLPYPFWHRGFSVQSVIEATYLTHDGLWTTPLRVTATYVFLFILFGSFLVASGAGTFFTDLARALAGRFTGGAAKTAVLSSALMGTLSGSSAANVVVTGSFTIPAMQRAGYRPRFAAGVEAVASSGGQFMPPIMGSAAFIMAEFIGVPYLQIAAAAIAPALLYFLSVIAMVDFEARRLGLKPQRTSETLLPVLLSRGYLLLPVVVLVGVLMAGYTPARAAFYSLVALVVMQVAFDPALRRRFVPYVVEAMDQAPRLIGQVTVASAIGGIIVGVVTQTGLGLRMSSIVLSIAQDHLWLLLILTMVSGIILGMGMPTPAAYVILAVLLAPGMVEFGVPPIAAHLFVLYCAGISAITPPVAMASYAAAAVANTDPWRTSVTAFRLGLCSFIIPYMFVYGPGLLGLGSSADLIYGTLAAALGAVALAGALIGWFFGPIRLVMRALLFAGALLLIQHQALTDLAGAAMVLSVAAVAWMNERRTSDTAKGRASPSITRD
jgi:TRAP transporter 4TM/12TM fusion protein